MSDSYPREPTEGGVGTITRPSAPRRATRPRQPGPPGTPREPKRRPAVWTDERAAQRRARREDTGYRRRGGGRGQQSEQSRPRPRQMPFLLMVCVLLGGALISALVISTTLAGGSYQITRLQQTNDALARQRQMLQNQVAQAQSAQVIAQRALRLGMRPAGELRFVNLKTGKVQTDAGTGALRNINVPGYTP